jgi:signal recognition particle subunit SRP54
VFENLALRLQNAFNELRRRGSLRPEDVDQALREIRLALLEADVHYQVVKDMLAEVREQALGEEVSRALNPAQQVIQIVQHALIGQLGVASELNLRGEKPRVVLLIGLQGSGKTTTTAKLARLLKAQGERVWMIAADPYRPAAGEQLRVLGEQLDVAVFAAEGKDAVELSRLGIEAARRNGATVALIDSAGRTQIDPEMMAELQSIQDVISPTETLLVADAMTGQEAIHIAQGFSGMLDVTGIILTKMDGDARGGAAISMRAISGLPIKFIGSGEALEALDRFEPERMASRILGMGDVLSMIEKAQDALDLDQAQDSAERMLTGAFTLDDFAEQLAAVRRMGPLGKLLDLLPGGLLKGAGEVDPQDAEKKLDYTQAILQSMTKAERRNPDLLNASRKRRIAAGSGTSVQEVNLLIRQYRQMRKMFKQIGKRGLPNLGDLR